MVGTDGQQRRPEQTDCPPSASVCPGKAKQSERKGETTRERETGKNQVERYRVATEEKICGIQLGRHACKPAYQRTSVVVVYNQATTCMTRLCFLLSFPPTSIIKTTISVRRHHGHRKRRVCLPYTASTSPAFVVYSIKQPASMPTM